MGHAIVFGFLGIKTVNTLTPLWLVGLGALLGILLIAAFWGILWGLSLFPGLMGVRRAADEMWTTIREGVLFPVLIVASVFGAIGLLGTVALRPIGDSIAILGSLPRLNQVGSETFEATIPGAPQSDDPEKVVVPPEHPMSVVFRGDELRSMVISSTENLSVSHEQNADMDSLKSVNVKSGETYEWRRRPNSKSPFGDGTIYELNIRNRGPEAAKVAITVRTEVVYPEVRAILTTAIGVFCVFLLYFLQATLWPRLSAIALATFKSEVAQPLFMIILILGTVYFCCQFTFRTTRWVKTSKC